MMSRPRQNILWVVTTQWRGQAWGQGGDKNAKTPGLDALAARGVNYRQATTPHPFGPFARAAMLTGVLSPENGVKNYYDSLPQEARTIAHDMGEAGYRTAFFGKWHLAKRDPEAPLVGEAHARMIVPPEARGGFGFWEGFESGFWLNDPWLHGSRLEEPEQFSGYQSDVVTQRAADWFSRQSEPWFGVVSLEAPHPPYDAGLPVGIKRRTPADIQLTANVPADELVQRRARRELAGYYGHIEATDRAMGRLIQGLDETTIVVVTSVHGDMHGAHGRFRKGWPHDESVRVPLVVKSAPGRAAGSSSDEAISLVDLPEMTRAWSRGDVWICARERAPISMPSVVALADQCDYEWSGWRSAKRKEIYRKDGTEILVFDLEADPLEQCNLGLVE